MKQTIYLITIFILIASCSRQVKKTQQTQETPVSTQATPSEPINKLEVKRARIRQVMIGKEAPIGTITAENGLAISNRAYEGKLLVIDFWATWCGPCLQGAPKFKELGDKYRSDKVEFISVSIDKKFESWKSFLITRQWSSNQQFWMGMKKENPLYAFLYKEVYDEGEPIVIIGVPKYVIISPEGKIIDNEAAFPTNPAFEAQIKQLIAEQK